MITDPIASDVPHPSHYLKEEMEARGWSISDVAKRMPGIYGVNFLSLELYLEIGAMEPQLRIGEAAPLLATAFGVDADLFSNLEAAWLRDPAVQAAIAKELH